MTRKRKRGKRFPTGFAQAESGLDDGVARLLIPAGEHASLLDERLRAAISTSLSSPQTALAMLRSKMTRTLGERLKPAQRVSDRFRDRIRQQVVNGFTAIVENTQNLGFSPSGQASALSTAAEDAAVAIAEAAGLSIDGKPGGLLGAPPVAVGKPLPSIIASGIGPFPPGAGVSECIKQFGVAACAHLTGKWSLARACEHLKQNCNFSGDPAGVLKLCDLIRKRAEAGPPFPECGVSGPPIGPPIGGDDGRPPGEEPIPDESEGPTPPPTHCGLFVDCRTKELYFVRPGEELHNDEDKPAGAAVDICALDEIVDELCRVPPPPIEGVECGLYLDCRTKELYVVQDGGRPRSSDDRRIEGAIPTQEELESECEFRCKPEGDVPEDEEESPEEPEDETQPPEEDETPPPRQPGRVKPCADLPFAGVFNQSFLEGAFSCDPEKARPLFELLERFGVSVTTFPDLFAFLFSCLTNLGIGAAVNKADAATRLAGCFQPDSIKLLTTGTILGFLQQWLGVPTQNLTAGNQNQLNFNCPTGVPDPASALQAFLADAIDEETWECWTRAGNLWFPAARKMVDVSRSKPNEAETLGLWRRGIFNDKQYADGMRQIGWLPGSDLDSWRQAQAPLTGPADLVQLHRRKIIDEDEYSNRMNHLGFNRVQHKEFFELSKQFPGIAELIQFMVRDADDERIVERFGLDSQFEEKFGGELRELADQTAVPERIMRLAWRSHWDIPGPQALFSMLHRSRVLPDGDPAKATQEDIEAALIQQDILPFWIPKILNTTFTLLTRVDIRRFFELGVIGRGEVVEEFVKRGYSDLDADRQAEFAAKNLSRKIRNSPPVKRFAKGEINEADLRNELHKIGVQREVEDEAVEAAKRLMSIDTRKVCLGALRKRFLLGDFDVLQARDLIIGLGLDADQAASIANKWACERDAKGKLAPANTLCGWLERGAIAAGEMVERLVRLGWSDNDALRLLADCQARINLKVTREQAARVKSALKEAEKNRKEREQMLKAMARDNEKSRREREKQRDNETRRETIALEIAARLLPEDGDLSDVQGNVVRAVRRFRSRYLLDFDTILEIGAEVAQRVGVKGDFAGWASETSEVLAGYPALPASQSEQLV